MTTNERPEKVEAGLFHQFDGGTNSVEPPRAPDSNAFCIEYLDKIDAICKKYGVSAAHEFGIHCEIVAASFILEATDADYAQMSEHQPRGVADSMAYCLAKMTVAYLKEKGIDRANVSKYMDNRIKEFDESARKGMYSPKE